MVVCSRFKEYNALKVRLQFSGAIYLEPLTATQISQYLSQIGDKLTGLRQALPQDEVLQELAHSPLMLNIMSLAYEDTPAEKIIGPHSDSVESRRSDIFDTYIKEMFSRKSKRLREKKEEIKKRLAWLAWNMQGHNQTTFLIENLQPSWLIKRRLRWAYVLASRLIGAMIFYISLCLLIIGLSKLIDYDNVWLSIFWILIDLFCIGFVYFIFEIINFYSYQKISKYQKLISLSLSFMTVIFIGFILTPIDLSLIGRLFFGLIFALFFGSRGNKQSLVGEIEAMKILHFYWSHILNVKNLTVLIFTFIYILYVLTKEVEIVNLYNFIMNSLISLIISMFLLYTANLREFFIFEKLETTESPNEGIWLSTKNFIFGGLSIGLMTGIIFGLSFGLTNGLIDGLIGGVIFGLFWGLIACLWYGGFDVIKHCILRAILIYQGHTPRKYADFLDDTAKLIFLQKVGGGYQFYHSLLRDHFAKM